MLEFPKGQFATILADPPWSFRDKGSRAAPDCKKHFDYSTMTAKEILALPVDTLALPQAHLYLWTTDTHAEIAFQVMRAWGFEFKQFLTWIKAKMVPSILYQGDYYLKIMMGMGHNYRHGSERVLFGTRGGLRTLTRNTLAEFVAPRGKHSVKPESFYDIIEANSPGPRLELFARGKIRKDWQAWGNEIR